MIGRDNDVAASSARHPDRSDEDKRENPWPGQRVGILPDIADIAGLPPRRDIDHALGARPNPQSPVRHVEDKAPDWQRVQEILGLSARARRWANFGPVSLALERAIEFLLQLPPDRAVVVCASATVGLNALAGLHAVKLGRKLRWTVSAYTFFNQHSGAFADAHIVDCGENGLIDLAAVTALPEESWDGLVVTNLFAGLRETRRYFGFCQARGKALILDSAIALFGPERGSAGAPVETVSFHHTKPWGFGEGGCVIVDRDDAPLMRSAFNFAIGGPDLMRPFAGNGKMSDVAAAPILERLERLPSWADRYQAQRARIEAQSREAGLSLLLPAPRQAILASVPVLAARPLTRAELPQCGFDMGKYYPPLGGVGETARRIFARIANIPAHSGMEAVGSEAMAAAMQMLAAPPDDRQVAWI